MRRGDRIVKIERERETWSEGDEVGECGDEKISDKDKVTSHANANAKCQRQPPTLL
jgi:hypothetical protein